MTRKFVAVVKQGYSAESVAQELKEFGCEIINILPVFNVVTGMTWQDFDDLEELPGVHKIEEDSNIHI